MQRLRMERAQPFAIRKEMWMNNIRLKQKMILIFIVCVLVPLFITNSFILWSMKTGMDREQEQKIENIADRLEYGIRDSINKQISIADYLNRSVKLNNFLEREYQDEAAYYDAYFRLMEDDVIHYYYTVQSAHNIVICTDNPTVMNGNYFLRKSDVEGSRWYRAFQESGRQLLLYSYYEDGQESAGYIEKGRHIVIIRRLNYSGENNIIMLDLDYSSMLEQILMECDDIDGYISNADKIIFSTQDTIGYKNNFLPLSEYVEKEYAYGRTLELYGETLDIRLTTDHYSIWQALKSQGLQMLLLYVANLLIPTLVVYIIYRSLHDRVAITQEYLDKVQQGVYEVIPCEQGSDEIGSMLRSYNLMVLTIKELIEVVFKNKERAQSLELSKKQAELNAMQSQLNPHFIFNALESIRMHSIIKQETETARILESFAVLMRKNIQWNSDLVTIEEECDNVRRYLDIQKYRFGSRLEFNLYVQEECRECKIPKFIIITFVENACVHGIENSVEGGSITVMVSGDETYLYIEIMDSGSGMTEEELDALRKRMEEADISYLQNTKKSIGIVNTVLRMRQYYDGNVQVDINSTVSEGTEICIRIPLKVDAAVGTEMGDADDKGAVGR